MMRVHRHWSIVEASVVVVVGAAAAAVVVMMMGKPVVC
jgi:hypothetical protein